MVPAVTVAVTLVRPCVTFLRYIPADVHVPLQVQQLGLLASTLQALVTGCCCCTHCASASNSSNQGAHLATQMTRALLEALIKLDRQLSSPSAAATAKDSLAAAVNVDRLIQQCKQLVKQQQQQQQQQQEHVGVRTSYGGSLSPRACSSSPRAGIFALQQQQQQRQQAAEADHLQQLADQAALEAERLQLQEERAQVQQQVSSWLLANIEI
jgi:hypothetical protein